MATDRRAEVTWQGSLMEGSGTIVSTTSGKLGEQAVSWPNRAEDNPEATSPEELIAAAHAACFAMSLSNEIGKAGGTPQALDVTAHVTLGPDTERGGFAITGIKLEVEGEVEGLDAEGFDAAAQAAKAGCPVSKALAGTTITLDASLA